MRSVVLAVIVLCTGCVLKTTEIEGGCACEAGEACVEGECVPAADAAPLAADAALPDIETTADAAPPALQACEAQFGAQAGYQLCVEAEESCEFFAQSGGATCAAVCESFGSECLRSYDSNADAPCTVVTEEACQSAHSTQTCVCARTPASGAVGP